MKAYQEISWFWISFLLLLPEVVCSQGIYNTTGSYIVANGEVYIVVQNGGYRNDGQFVKGSSTLILNGTTTISGSSNSVFNNININGGVDFGDGKSSVNGILQINYGGYVNNHAPKYGASSTLKYNVNGTYSRGLEWSASGSGVIGSTVGYPNHIVLSNNTTLELGANSGTATARSLEGNLSIEQGSTLTMNSGGAMTQPVTVKGNITIEGTLTMSSSQGGDLNVGGNWSRSASSGFTQNNGVVRFFGSSVQSINVPGGETFSYMTIDKTSNKVLLASNLTVTKTIAIDNGTFDVSTASLVVNDVITKAAGGALLSEETGTVVYNKTSSTQSVIYAEYGNLALSNNSAKTLANNLAVKGDFTVAGGAVTPGDDMRFSGNREQNIAGLLNYKNIAFSGTGNYTKRFTSHSAFSGAMTFTGGAGTVDLDGSGNNLNFTVISNAAGTAQIGNVNGWTVAGNAIVERYIPSQRKWRLISIPVTGETIRQSLTRQADGTYPSPVCFGSTLQGSGSGTLITGHSFSSCDVAVANGFDHVQTGGLSSIRFYNPTQSNPWASATSTPNILAAPTQSGYLVFIRGDRNQLETGSNETTLKPKGSVKQNNQTISVNAPFVVLGNPYASPIHLDQLYDFKDATGNKTKITRNFWIWDADLNTSYGGSGGYRSISADMEGDEITSYTVVPSLPQGTNINDYLMINSGQAIIVQRRNSGGTITVKENYKYVSSGNTYPFRIKASTVSLFRIDMYRATGTSLEILMDGTVARFGNDYSKASNEVYDIYKSNQFEENINLVRDNNYLAIESRPIPTSSDTLYVPFYYTTNRGYALKFSTERMAALNLTAVLQDAFTATETQVPLDGSEFIYPFSVTTATASKALNRFRIVLRNGSVTPVIDLFADKGINIYPNPVQKGETINLQFKNKAAGKYKLTLYDAVGLKVFSMFIVHTGGTGVQRIELPKGMASGTYFADLNDGKGNQGKMKVIVQ